MPTPRASAPPSSMPCWTDGPADAPTVVFVHGATADHRSWDPQVEALRDRFRTVTVDLAGHGDSPRRRFEFDAAVAGLLELLDDLGRPVALVGLSLGGALVQEVVYRAPDRVDALVVADATCVTARRGPLDKAAATAALSGMALLPRAVFQRRAAGALARDDDVADALRGWSPAAAAQVLVELVAHLHPDPDYRLPVPTLLLHGADDRFGDIARGSRDWAGRDPLVEYAVVPDAGHLSNRDNPEAFTTELRSFLDRVLAGTGTPARAPEHGGRTRRRPPPGAALSGLARRLRAARRAVRAVAGVPPAQDG